SINKYVYQGGRFGKGGSYDMAKATKLPVSWTSKESKLFDNPLQVKVMSPQDAEEGNYTFSIVLSDWENAELLGNFTFNVVVTITNDVVDSSLDKRVYAVGPDQPLRLVSTIYNKGNVGDVYVVKATVDGMEKTKEVFVPPNSLASTAFEFSFSDKDTYNGELIVESKHSPAISSTNNFTVVVEGTLFEDAGATGKGSLLLFLPFQPIYDVLYLIYSVVA
ncbi:MAG: hypothetical protein D6769_02655, partial [Methanobacteriota archaeon]